MRKSIASTYWDKPNVIKLNSRTGALRTWYRVLHFSYLIFCSSFQPVSVLLAQVERRTVNRVPLAKAIFPIIDQNILLRSFARYCSGRIYRSFQFFSKVKATSTGKLHNSLPRNDAANELCSGEFKMAYCYNT
jgi:hypothetical protein